MILIFLSILFPLISQAVSNLTPPYWGGNSPIYSVTVNLTNPEPIANWIFDYYYDNSRFGFAVSRYNHHPPQFDEMCVDSTFPDHRYECDVIHSTDGWTYISFPEKNFCCKCENTFGSVKYEWLQTNSTFIGYETINGVVAEKWDKMGQYLNHYYCDSVDKKPIRFNELWGPNQILKQWDFIQETYNDSLFDVAIVQPPENCQTFCQSQACIEYRD